MINPEWGPIHLLLAKPFALSPVPVKGDCGITAGDDYGWELYTKSIFCGGQNVWDSEGQEEMQRTSLLGTRRWTLASLSRVAAILAVILVPLVLILVVLLPLLSVLEGETTLWLKRLSELHFLHLLLWFWVARTIFLVRVREGCCTSPGHTLLYSQNKSSNLLICAT